MYLAIFMTFCACQAERELQPWIAKDDDQGQKMWRINQRIIKLMVGLMRNHDTPDSLVILASASDLLLRATDGMLVDGEACTLPQLEVTMQLIFLDQGNCVSIPQSHKGIRAKKIIENLVLSLSIISQGSYLRWKHSYWKRLLEQFSLY